MDFKEFVKNKAKPAQPKLWNAKKEEILEFWRTLKPNLPLKVEPIPKIHEGTRYTEDGLRITGSPEFINGILSRLKDFINYETTGTKLDVEYKQIQSTKFAKTAYACYIHVEQK